MAIKRSVYSKSKAIEKQEIGVLKQILSDKLIEKLTSGDDTYPDTDGHLQLLNSKRETTGLNLEVQIKPLSYAKKTKAPFSLCPSKLLAYAASSNLPLLFIAVDPTEQVAYWLYLSKETAATILGKSNVPAEKRLYFNRKNIIKKGDDSYLKEWKDICNHHFNKTNDHLIKDLLADQKDVGYLAPEVLIERIKTLEKLAHYRSVKGEHLVVPHILSIGQKLLSEANNSPANERVLKVYIEALDVIRYFEPKEVFNLLYSFSKIEINKNIQSVLIEKMKHVAAYNYHALISLGYGPQEAVHAFLETHDIKEKISNIDTLKIVYESLLEPSYDGTSMRDDITMVFHRGPLNASPYLAKFRRKVVIELISMFKIAKVQDKLKILEIILHSTHVSHEIGPDEQKEKAQKMIEGDVRFFIKEITNIILEDNKIIVESPIVLKLEQQLGWMKRVHGGSVPPVGKLLERLQNDKGIYGLYRLLIGQAFQLRDEDDYQTVDREWKEAIDKHVQTISEGNLKKYLKDLSDVAKMSELEPLNGLVNFKTFLVDVGKTKPNVAKKLIEQSVQSNLPLSTKLAELIGGIRNSGNRAILDSVIDFLSHKKQPDFAVAIAASFIYLDKGNVDKVSPEDISILENIIFRKDKFDFEALPLKYPNFYYVLYGVFRISALDPGKCRKIFLELLKNYPDQVILNLMTIDFALRDGMLSLSDWPKVDLEHFAGLLVKVSSLEHHGTEILIALGEVDFELFMDVLYRRMLEKQKSSKTFELGHYYQAIPRHADELKPLFEKNTDKVKEIVKVWSKKHLGKISVFSYNLSSLLDSFAPSIAQEIIYDLVLSGKKKQIAEAIELLPKFDSIDIQFCLRLVEITDDKDLIRTLKGYLTNVGSVSGPAGENLFGKAWQAKVNEIEALANNTSSKKGQRFIAETVTILKQMIAASEKEHQAELEKRKMLKKEQEDE